MSRVQVAALDFNSAIVMIPVSPLEEHGPHLPVGTDFYISETLSQQLAEMVEKSWPEVKAVICPLIPLGAYAVPGPGSVTIRPQGLHAVLFDFIRGLSRSGFRYVVICSAHGSIEHFVVLEEVAERSLRELGVRVEPALSRVVLPFLMGRYMEVIEKRLGRPLTEEERGGLRSDCHGGQWETGCMMHIRPDLVHGDYGSLQPILMNGWLHLRQCMADSCAQNMGYVGAPALATAEYSQAAAEVLLEIVLERIDRMLHDRRFRPSHTPFYYVPFYHSPRSYKAGHLARALGVGLAAGTVLGVAAGVLGSWMFRRENGDVK